jgi:predicted secreted Zn-dependent protease
MADDDRRPRLAARDRLPEAPRLSPRSLVAALALLAGLGSIACSSPPPAPPRQPVGVETSVATRYYPVRGTTTAAIFTAIDANGLVETSGQRAVGVTSADWKLTSGDVDVRTVPCVFPSLTVMLHLVVMLPRHETPDDLPADLRSRWEGFVARIAAHEQRHVDIYLEGAKAMKARLEATRTAVSCADLEKAIDSEWRAQQADIARAQAEFHAVDETTARSEREALQARLDDTRARLEPVDAEVRRLDTELADLRRQVDAGRADLVAQHGALAGRRRALAEEHNRLVADANGLIDALNWARW